MGEWTLLRRDGAQIPVEINLRRLADGRLLGIARDITTRRQMENSMKVAVEAATSASRAKSEFLANMSHEIRTPLNAVLGFAELLAQSRLDPEQAEYLTMIRDSGTMLLTLLNDILDLSKIEAQQMRLENVGFDLEPFIEGVLRMAAARFDPARVRLLYAMDRMLPRRLVGDPTRLRQIFINLLGNAAKFTPAGWVRLSVEDVPSSGLPPGTRLLRGTVRDTGIGVTQDKIQQIFRPFVQADASITRRYGGTGLGLAITLHLVRMMGGEISAGSPQGGGAEFVFTVRLREAPEQPVAAPAVGAGRKVWIVSDHAAAREAFEGLCGDRGFAIRPLGYGEALEELERGGKPAVDLLIWDADTPAGRLRENWVRLAQMRAGARLRVLGIQSAAQDMNTTGVFDTCLAQPILRSELVGALSELIGHTSA